MSAAFVLLFVVVAYRIVSGFVGIGDSSWLHNFAPIAAVALCGAAYLPRRVALALPLAMLFLSDLVLNPFCYHAPLLTAEMIPRYIALALIAGLGFAMRRRARPGPLLAASIAGSLIFYVITNTGSWIYEPGYAKTFAGWLQALTTGLPAFAATPTWIFLRNTLLGDLFFTGLFVVCMHFQAHKDAPPVREKVLAPW